MSTLVILSLGQGNLFEGFPAITVQVGETGKFYKMKVGGSLPPAPEIARIYQGWRSLYAAYYQSMCLGNSREIDIDDELEIEEGNITNFSSLDLTDLSHQLSALINAWLSSPEFSNIERQLRTQLKPNQEIRFIIENNGRNDISVRRLPWHLWNFFEDYFLTEVALSTYEHKQPNRFDFNRPRNTVKILAIFGESTGIDIDKDRNFLENLSHQAEIKFLVEPLLSDLNEQLWQEGWDILFFAGHTSGKNNGLVYINQTDTITIEQIKYALKQAIGRGLKLAIFNSCDSLALAQQLQDLQIPQVIVMREPVPDLVAQDFLKYFLAEFSQGKSLYTAVRFARERLQVLETNYPCATWLPVICQNPTEAPIIWTQKGLISENLINQPIYNNPISSGIIQTQENSGGEYLSNSNTRAKEPAYSRKNILLIILTSLLVTASIMGVRYFGILQPLELKAYDHLMRLRPIVERADPRLLIITIDEADIKYQNEKKMNLRWSLSDEALAKLLVKLDKYEPKAIGIDIYRDFSTDNNFPNLVKRLQEDNRIFAVCKVSVSDDGRDGVSVSNEIPRQQVGFGDVIADDDDIPRRQLLFLNPPLNSPCNSEYAFTYLLAKKYLQDKGYEPKFNQENQLVINDVVFKRLKSHSGGYQQIDAQGYQILLNYRSLASVKKIAPIIALKKILEDEIEPSAIESIKNRIILIGVTASSSADYWKTPYSKSSSNNQRQVPGVYVQAQMISQILGAVENKRPLIWWLPQWLEALWVFAWSVLGASLAWFVRRNVYLGIAIAVSLITLFVLCGSIFTQAGWIPLVPNALALIICAVVVKNKWLSIFVNSVTIKSGKQ
ncbi:putative transmembrane sensor domain protein [Rivularia sp. PCC 7116]|uniref:CHASE2 domain-containing protein n=1 Tax=Rivularia sp. PCC 7116 TaxID=373994 RepID=UPI00029F3495|nr:CHASE2 domain-containing protein [Rivularia sp. PCC 7116]AFY56077.1 putative transmembrane sensor domain protein [Rivularia sp. PCC 7116]